MSGHERGDDPRASRRLARVLRVAAAPAHPQELAGEQAAVAAFRAGAPRRRSLLARVLTVKVLVVGAVAASTGVVLATAGGLPWPAGQPVPPAPRPAVTDSAPVPALPQPAGPPTGTAPPPRSTATPAPTCADRCADPRAWRDRERHRDERPRRYERHRGEEERVGAPTTTEWETRTRTPDSPTRGDGDAVPPSGVEPPRKGG